MRTICIIFKQTKYSKKKSDTVRLYGKRRTQKHTKQPVSYFKNKDARFTKTRKKKMKTAKTRNLESL